MAKDVKVISIKNPSKNAFPMCETSAIDGEIREFKADPSLGRDKQSYIFILLI